MKYAMQVMKIAQWIVVMWLLLSSAAMFVSSARAHDASADSAASVSVRRFDAVVVSARAEAGAVSGRFRFVANTAPSRSLLHPISTSLLGRFEALPDPGPSPTATTPPSTTTTVLHSGTIAPSATLAPSLTPTSSTDAGTAASAAQDTSATALATPDVSATASTPLAASATPTATAAAIVTPQAGVEGTVRVQMLHLREGPGAAYPIRAAYPRDAVVQILGTDRSRSWLRVVTADERAGWMAAENVAFAPSVADLAIVDGSTTGGASAPPVSADLPMDGGAAIPATSGVDADAAIANITDAPEGLGMIVVPATGLYVAPGVRTEIVQVLHEHEQVKLFGQARGAWVRVQPFTSVVPGWVYAAHLEPLPSTIAGAPAITMTLTAPVSPTLTELTPTASASPTPIMVDAQPQPPLMDTPVSPQVRLPVEVVVAVERADRAPVARRGATPTPVAPVGIAGLRVELVNVFGDVLAEAVTPADGWIVFNRGAVADTALFIQIRALGLRTQLDAAALAQGRAEVMVGLPPIE